MNSSRSPALERSREALELMHEKALVMYRQLPNVLIFTFVASSALMLYYRDIQQLWLWWGAMQAAGGLRLISWLYWRYRWSKAESPAQSSRATHVFVVLSLVTGALWACFSIAFFPVSTSSQRLVIALVMATVAAGSVNVLALAPWASRAFIALLIGPLVVMFASTGERDELVIAALGIALFIGLTGFARVASQTANHLLLMAQERNHKIAHVFAQREALQRDKSSLQSQLAEKVETLEQEMALKERYARELARVAALDSLTGLLNRSAFERELHQQLQERAGTLSLALVAVEIRRFDLIELQGARTSEQVLAAIANRLRDFSEGQFLLARTGTAEFALALNDPEQRWQDRGVFLRAALQKNIETDIGPVAVDVILGIATVEASAQDLETLSYRASIARQDLRLRGAGGVVLFDPDMEVEIRRRQKLRFALHAALEARSLTLVFQPIEPCLTRVPRKLEALLRWDDPELGTVSPALFIPVAEESGLIMPLGRWVLLESCRAAMSWPGDAVVSVNVSVQQILAGDLASDVRRALELTRLPAQRLEIEITESVFSRDLETICKVLEQVRALGVSIAIDDFGTGYSSLAYLRYLPVDVIKIDRCFIQSLDQGARKLLLALCSMARGLGFRVVVEGVETAEQQNLLVAMGVDYLQGYLIARPMVGADVPAWLVQRASHS